MKAMTGSIDTACLKASMLPAGTVSNPVTCSGKASREESFAAKGGWGGMVPLRSDTCFFAHCTELRWETRCRDSSSRS